jgi:hypothetical protein
VVAGAGAVARRHLVGGGGRRRREVSGIWKRREVGDGGARRVAERAACGREVSVAVGERGAWS